MDPVDGPILASLLGNIELYFIIHLNHFILYVSPGFALCY